MPDNIPELVVIPEDLTLIGVGDLQDLESRAVAEFNRLSEDDQETVTPEVLERLTVLTDGVERVRAELTTREDRASREAAAARTRLADDRARLAARVNGPSPENGGTTTLATVEPGTDEAVARGVTAALISVLGQGSTPSLVADMQRRATATLADAQRHAPGVRAPSARLSVTAGVDIPGMARNAELPTVETLAEAFIRRARSMPVSRDGNGTEQLVASIRNDFEHTVDDRTSPRDVAELFRHLTRDDLRDSLVAGGGWCAPSEIRYDFFNVACEDGLIDLPTFGVSRGGIRWPVSPSLADVFGGVTTPLTATTNPWLWTETNDILAVTGTGVKPCVRVPCPSFDEERLECFGICLTAGNLTDDAYPEATVNYLRLLTSAHAHAVNGRTIAQMVSMSAACVTGGAFATGGPAFNAITGGASLAATDYRARYGMCEDDVLEIVLPQWVLGAIQADVAYRTGTENTISVTRDWVNSQFAARNVRVQWVNDWQVRGTGQFGAAAGRTSWPTSVNMLVYAAGTFLRGNGLSLDLGVVRDSVLNEKNDHTAAWSEECQLVAMVGHESRCYTVTFSVSGNVCCNDQGTDPLP